ncbi:DUF2254 domain-containing protein [Loktanella agnita]|uniref:DUF2254 domain-containing protein n=1 Tax=Loktanella agnita TaxID=287097 RepID=UPI00398A4AC3
MGKRARLFKFLQDVRASYWFLPSILVIVGLILAAGSEWIDRNADLLPMNLPDTLIDTQADGARATLSVIAQSIIGVAGVMFSMTIVAVSFASGNFGPRLIGNFMRDRGNQWSLGILIATFVYALVVLSSVQDATEGVDQYVPQYSLILALLLTLVSVFTMIYFVHHVPETINVSRISSGLGTRLENQIRVLIDGRADEEDGNDWPDGPPTARLTGTLSGYIQTCNIDRIHTLAAENNWHIRMSPAIGEFVTCATEIFGIWSTEPVTDDQRNALMGCYAVGSAKTENQNPAFMAEQLVEMIARALSPGVNDPYTAMDCLNRLSGALTVASVYKDGLSAEEGTRFRYPKLNFAGLFAVSFPLCRQYVRPDDVTRQHTQHLLENLAEVARPADRHLITSELAALTPDSTAI